MLAGFAWVIPGRLAGSAQPGLLDEFGNDMTFLRERGVKRIVTLTEQPLAFAEGWGFETIHFPINDMGIPTPRACAVLCRELVGELERAPTLVHCHAGLGRTGTIIACCLITMGQTPDEALETVRRVNRHYVQSPPQEKFLDHYRTWMDEEG